MTGNKNRRTLFLSLFCLLLLLSLAVTPYAYRQAKKWRAAAFVRKAETAMGRGDAKSAQENLLLAQKMSPGGRPVVRGWARYQFLQNNPECLMLWIDLVNRDPMSLEDWEGLFLASMRAGNKKLAYRAIEGFRAAAPEDKKVRQFECRLLASDRRYDMACYLAREIVDVPDQKKDVLLFAYEVLLSGSREDRQRALRWFLQKSFSDGQEGLSAIVVLARDQGLDTETKQKLGDRLSRHPLAQLEHQILSRSLLIHFSEAANQEKKARWQEFGKSLNPKERPVLARWFLENGQWEMARDLVGQEDLSVDKKSVALFVDILGAGKQWEKLKFFLHENEEILPKPLWNLYLSRAYFETGDPRTSDLHWRLALDASRALPESLRYMANYAAIMKWDERAREVCELLIRDSGTERIGYQGLLMLAWQRGNKEEAQQIAERMRKMHR